MANKSDKKEWESWLSKMDWDNTFNRTGAWPLDRASLFKTVEDAKAYAKSDGSDERGLGGNAYQGQIISVLDNNKVKVYKILSVGAEGKIEELASSTSVSGDVKKEEEARIAQDNIIEGSIGLAADGNHVKTNGKYTSAATTVVGEIAALDAALTNTDAKIAGMDYTIAVEDGNYLDGFTQTDGKITAHTTKPFDTALNSTSVKAPQTKVVDAAIKKAKTEVKHAEGNARVTVSSSAATDDGHQVYTITENDIAQKTLLDAEIKSRKAIEGQTGATYSANTANTVTYIKAADSLNNADVLLDEAIKNVADAYVKSIVVNGISGTTSTNVASVTVEAKDVNLTTGYTPTTYPEGTPSKITPVQASSTIENSVKKLDENFGLLVNEILDNERVVAEALTAIKNGVGLEDDGSLKLNSACNYISEETSVSSALEALDLQIKKNQDSEIKLSAGDGISITGEGKDKTIAAKLDTTTGGNALQNGVKGIYLSNVWNCGTF